MKAVIHKLELPAAGRIIAISDVHGNLPYLRGLMDKLDLRGEDTQMCIRDSSKGKVIDISRNFRRPCAALYLEN